MTIRFLAAGLALASLISPTIAAAQVADRAGAPSGTAPLQAPCVVQADGTCAAVKASVPLPVTDGDGAPITSTTLTGNGTFFTVDMTGYRGASILLLGQSGQATFSVEGSNDGGTTWTPLQFMNTSSNTYTTSTQTAGLTLYVPKVTKLLRGRLSQYAAGTWSVNAYLMQTNVDPGNVQVSGISNVGIQSGGLSIVGNLGNGATDNSNPVKIGGQASASVPTAVANGQRVNAWYTLGGAAVTASAGGGGALDGLTSGAVQTFGAANNQGGALATIGYVVNAGGTADRQRSANTAVGGDGTGLLGVGNLGFDGAAWRAFSVSTGGLLNVNGSAGQFPAIGSTAHGTTDNQNPVKIGGYASSVAPTAVATGQRTNAWFGLSGETMIGFRGAQNVGTSTSLGVSIPTAADGSGRPLWTVGGVSDGVTIYQQQNAAAANNGTGNALLGAGILGRAQSTLNPLTDNTYNAVAIDTRGNVRARLVGSNSVTPNDSGTTYTNVLPAPSATTETSGAPLAVGNFYWSGTAVIAARGDTTGAYTVEKGGPSIATSQTSVGTTAALVAPARVGRNKVTVTIGAANSCVLGNAGVTLSTGYPLQPVAGASITLDTAAAIYAVCSATTTVSDIETF